MEPANDRQPLIVTRAGDADITLLGTAHVSRSSAEKVAELLDSGRFDAVAVELCRSRYEALTNPDAFTKLDLLQVIRKGRAAMVTAQLAMGAYQQRLAEQFGIEPGEEQRTALRLAEQHGLPVLQIDREIGVTMKRTAANLSWWKRWSLFSGLIVALVSREEVDEEEIERLKEGDILETAFAEFAHNRDDLYQPLIAERDRYMAARLVLDTEDADHRHILAVVGAGHLKGIATHLEQGVARPAEIVAELEQTPPGARWPKLIPWLIVALILIGFGIGFTRSPELGWSLVRDWVLINGTLSAVGALLATAHPLTILTAFVAAPITSLNPTVGAGMVTAATEVVLRRPQVGDFSSLRHDTTRLSGWWKNRVSRTLMVFLFSTLGSALGTYLAGFRIFDQLVR